LSNASKTRGRAVRNDRRVIKPPAEWGPWVYRPTTAGKTLPNGMPTPPELRDWARGLLWAAYNHVYTVQARIIAGAWGDIEHLVIRTNDRSPAVARAVPWWHYQLIKQLCAHGDQRWAVEVFPPNTEIVDAEDLYHLWVFPLGFAPPFNLFHGDVDAET
jgi:hypothetical protein